MLTKSKGLNFVMKKPGVEFTFFKWRVRFLNFKISKSQ